MTPDLLTLVSYETMGGDHGEGYWIGLKYNSTVGKYLWVSNNLEIENPDSRLKYTSPGDCVIVMSYTTALIPSPCDQNYKIICQSGKDLIRYCFLLFYTNYVYFSFSIFNFNLIERSFN